MKATVYQRMVNYGTAIQRKPYPKRLKLHCDIGEIIEKAVKTGDIGWAICDIKKYIQYNYRRRRQTH